MAKDLILCLSSAILLILSFPDFNLWILAWFGFVPLFFAIKNKSRGHAFLLAYFTGVIFWSVTIYWLVHVTLPGTILLVLYLALYFGLFGAVISRTFLMPTFYHPVLIPSLWVILEYVRSYLFTGFPWALLGYSQYQNLTAIQIADVTGVWGVSFTLMVVNVAVKEMITYRLKVGGYKRKAKSFFIVVLIGLFMVFGYGFFRLSRKTEGARLKVSVIQANIPQELKWDSRAKTFILDRYTQLTEKSAKDNPDLIVWPEASSPDILGEEAFVFPRIVSLAQKIRIPLLIGSVITEKGDYFNSALLIDRDGKIIQKYDKLHLVPFGEYIPLRNMLPFLQTVVPIGDIARGKEYTIFKAPGSRLQATSLFSVLICFEDLFPELSRRFVLRGAQFLVNITNDAWYKKTSAAEQHFQASVFRAVENRVNLVRSANTGISGFVTPVGRVISLVQDEKKEKLFIGGTDTQEILIPEAKHLTFYTRYGEIFIILLFIFAIYSIFQLIL